MTLALLVVDCLWLLPLAWLAERFPHQAGPIVVVAYAPLLFLVQRVLGRAQQNAVNAGNG